VPLVQASAVVRGAPATSLFGHYGNARGGFADLTCTTRVTVTVSERETLGVSAEVAETTNTR
jgi:hypothetical protein